MANAPIVSKEELENSGFTTLRDYLNDKRGLTRKGPMSVTRADPVTRDSEARNSRGRPAELDMSDRDELGKQMSESGTDMAMAQRDPEATAKFLRSGEAGNGRGSYYKSDGRAVIQKQNEAANEMKRESRGMKKGGAVKKMASGGSVSSASSRGDGIAQRGKTRGKMC
jgi:hypothetical protein